MTLRRFLRSSAGERLAPRSTASPVGTRARYPHSCPADADRDAAGRSARAARSATSGRALRARTRRCARAERAIEIALPERRSQPESVVAHLGPTNSGKTYHALEFLKERGRGVYAGPLRMLAQEAHRRLAAELGEDASASSPVRSGSTTTAPIICCTVEMAPARARCSCSTRCSGRTTPSAARPGRGSCSPASTATSSCSERSTPSRSCSHAFPDAEVKVFERILPLEFVGERSLRGLTPGTVVVAFSRKAVLALAGEVNRLHPGRVSVLYGAMPLSSRREEIDRFLGGRSDVTRRHRRARPRRQPARARRCSSPRRRSSTASRGATCCRGSWRRSPGRAGRFGLVERGHVGVADRGRLGERRSRDSSNRRSQPHVVLPSGHLGYRIVDEARIRPRLSDLGIDDPRRLDAALAAWHRVATREWAYESWLAVESLSPIRGRLAAVQRRLARAQPAARRSRTRGSSINAPVDEDNAELLATLALAVAGDTAQRSLLTFLLDPARLRDATLEEAEQAGRTASILRWFALQYPGVGGVTIERAAALEEAAAARVVARLRLEVDAPTIGRCRTCGAGRARPGSRSATAVSDAADGHRATLSASALQSARCPRPGTKLIAENRRSRHDYELLDRVEAGLVLTGTEVKALRAGHVQLGQAYADVRGSEVWLVGASISEYAQGNARATSPSATASCC